MKNIKKGSIEHLLLLITIYIIVGILLYSVFDILYCKFITKSTFVYSIQEDIVKPVTIGSIMAVCSWLIEKNTH